MIEPILGEGGVIPVSAAFFQAVRRVCDKHGALMIADEIQTGMGHTGALLASNALGAQPDIVVLAKALGSGVPIGAFLMRGVAAEALAAGDHGSTFGGNYLASAAAYYVTCKLTDTDILAYVNAMGEYFMGRLNALMTKLPVIVSVRGRGLMLGAELSPSISAAAVKKALLERGFLIATAGENTLRFLPPYVIRKEHIDSLIDVLETTLTDI